MGTKTWHLALVIVLMIILNLSTISRVDGEQQVPCYFIFGDSLLDNGNNNALQTNVKANYLPYGIDFPTGPTGRFSNGRNIADITAELMGFVEYIPSFATASCREILKGVNYASGGAGIRDETGQNLGTVISFSKQLLNHKTTVSRIVSLLGDEKSTEKNLSKCIYTVGIGNNDYINNYLMPQFYPTSRLHMPDQYAALLIEQYSQQLKTLYSYGARKVALFGIGPIGCTPANIATYDTNGSLCVDFINKAVQEFNTRLKTLVDNLNHNLQDAKFIYVNVYGISSGPLAGLQGPNPCCSVANIANNGGILTCIPFSPPCPVRALEVFYDATHPTEAANLVVAGRSYVSLLPSDTHPIDIRQLARL
ncbi:GDSL esterase/lipase At1g29660 [Citrus clementina]|nr:GDSL esterase/lipase At1g29660 [Citrus x clementina]